jgi:predicted nucleotidyltransferase
MMTAPTINVPTKELAEFCRKHSIRKHSIRKLAFFASVLREDFTPESDIDVLVEFAPGHTPGLKFFSQEAIFLVQGKSWADLDEKR